MPEKPATVPAYLASLPQERRAEFEALREWVRGVLPDAVETMGYGMPTYEKRAHEGSGRICAIACQKRYLALYLCESDALERHRPAFAHLNLGKGCIRFARLRDLPRAATRKLLREAARALH